MKNTKPHSTRAMKQTYSYLFLIACLLNFSIARAQDTFSITAVDPLTGLVGSAGASCVSVSVRVLSDVHPGVGVIHTQARYLVANQNYARTLMNIGLAPQQIIDSLIIHDAEADPSFRQYGIVDLIGGGRTAAYTGVNCFSYRNHIFGPTYTIQGNTLLGQQILDSMRTMFLNTPGTLTDKLMAALQGAKVVGADTRCLSRGTSSRGAFLRVARPTDPVDSLWLDLDVVNTPPGRDPIDSLQILYDRWRVINDVSEYAVGVPATFELHQNYPNPFNPSTAIRYQIPSRSHVTLKVYDVLGREVATLANEELKPGSYEVTWDASGVASGVYLYRLEAGAFTETKKLVLLR
jgi:uncharacterized Ntn-hydrolase superfamily protein